MVKLPERLDIVKDLKNKIHLYIDMNIVICTGGFDPCHSGHIEYFKEARKLGDRLVVGLNSDAWLSRKKGRPFMPWEDRLAVVSNIRGVDWAIEFNDSDNTAIDAIRQVQAQFPNDKIIFANGGDRTQHNIPEMCISNVDFVFGVGGTDKRNSSRWLLNKWKELDCVNTLAGR